MIKLTDNIKQQFKDKDLALTNKCLQFKPKINKEIGESICHTCSRNLKAGKLPRFAIANGLELRPVPKEIAILCDLEKQLIAQIIPFSKIVGLRGGAYQGVKGESVYVPIEPERVAKTVKLLPRKLTDAELVPLKLKRRLRYKGYYMHQTIRRTAVEKAIKCLMQINKLYKEIIYKGVMNKLTRASSL